jgi:hypothetical protein
MPYVGGEIASLFNESVLEDAGDEVASRVLQEFQDLTVRNTPIKYGNLRSSWHTIGPSRTLWGWTGDVQTEVSYAPHVEFGTGLWGPKHSKYLIKPKKAGGALSWFDPLTGKRVFASSVMHPGSPGAHMVLNASVKTEALIEEISAPIMRRWAQRAERLAD